MERIYTDSWIARAATELERRESIVSRHIVTVVQRKTLYETLLRALFEAGNLYLSPLGFKPEVTFKPNYGCGPNYVEDPLRTRRE